MPPAPAYTSKQRLNVQNEPNDTDRMPGAIAGIIIIRIYLSPVPPPKHDNHMLPPNFLTGVAILGHRSSALLMSAPEQRAADERIRAARR